MYDVRCMMYEKLVFGEALLIFWIILAQCLQIGFGNAA